MIFLTIAFILLGLCAKLLYEKSEKSKPPVSPSMIPEGVITPAEALTLDTKQMVKLQDWLARMNKMITDEINGDIRTYTHKFDYKDDDFPVESLYEMKRLYTQAGWIVKLKHKSKGDYYRLDKWWEMSFTLPTSVEPPQQMTKVRVIAEPTLDAGPSLEELGIDTLDARFKDLEKGKHK
jgi:hypothetical protein